MLLKKLVDAFGGVKQIADGLVVVESVDDVSNVLGKVDLGVPLALKKLGRTINKVGGKDTVEESLFVCFIHFIKTVAEKTKGGKHEDPVGSSFLKLLRNVDNGAAG